MMPRSRRRPRISRSSPPNREAVRGFHAAALAVGGRDNGTPGPRPYHPGYYSAFVLDPDGNNIEAVVDWAGWFENHR